MADVNLNHKLRNPKSYNEWMDIWTATVHDPESQGASPKYEIKPSDNWKISPDILDKIPVNKIENFVDKNVNPQTTTHNVTITDPNGNDPEGNHIAITNTDGSIREGAKIDPENGNSYLFLNQKGEFISDNTYTLNVKDLDTESENTAAALIFKNITKGTEKTIPIVGLNGIYTYTTAYGNSYQDLLQRGIGIKIKEQGVQRSHIADNAINSDKIDWGDPTSSTNSMSNNLKTAIGLNSSTNAGIVSATEGVNNAGKIWSVGSDGEPGWNSVSTNEWDKIEDESLTASKLDTRLLGALINTDKPVSPNSASLADEYKRATYKASHNDQEPSWWIDNNWDWKHLGIWIQI